MDKKHSHRVGGNLGLAGGRPPELAVYPAREDSFLLLPFAEVRAGTTLVEVGAGNGRAALRAARAGARVVATDLNRTALAQLARAARDGALRVDVVRTDLLRGLGRFDRILANPPYLPTRPSERDPDLGTRLALDGGPDGCRVFARLSEGLSAHLAPGASAFVIVSSLQDRRARARVLTRWRSRGGRHEVVSARDLEGERLEVVRLWRPEPERIGRRSSPSAPRRRARRRGTGARPRSRRPSRPASSRAPGPGRTSAPDAASDRRRSPRGS